MVVGIIGAGACGLASAVILEKYNIDYVIFERSNKIGSKILASGNGRCNISNITLANDNLLLDFLKSNDCLTKVDEEGRIYPLSNSSNTILKLFLDHIDSTKIKLNTPVTNIKKVNGRYLINGLLFDKLILASGSIANIKEDKQEIIYAYLKDLNINLTKLKPSLVGFRVKENVKDLFGIRIKAKVSLINDNQEVYSEKGEINFKRDGLSGIVIMNISHYYNQLDKLINPRLVIDIYNGDINFKEIKDYKYILPEAMYQYVIKHNIEPNNFILNIIDTYSFSDAQVVYGGISKNDINSDYSLKSDNNIYVGGELLEDSFICGGYNLNNAFNTGFLIGKKIVGEGK